MRRKRSLTKREKGTFRVCGPNYRFTIFRTQGKKQFTTAHVRQKFSIDIISFGCFKATARKRFGEYIKNAKLYIIYKNAKPFETLGMFGGYDSQ